MSDTEPAAAAVAAAAEGIKFEYSHAQRIWQPHSPDGPWHAHIRFKYRSVKRQHTWFKEPKKFSCNTKNEIESQRAWAFASRPRSPLPLALHVLQAPARQHVRVYSACSFNCHRC